MYRAFLHAARLVTHCTVRLIDPTLAAVEASASRLSARSPLRRGLRAPGDKATTFYPRMIVFEAAVSRLRAAWSTRRGAAGKPMDPVVQVVSQRRGRCFTEALPLSEAAEVVINGRGF
jgi:hypothetical protein